MTKMELFNLYKFLHQDRIDVLKNRKIRFSQPDALNDPFEFKPNLTGALSLESVLKGYSDPAQREILVNEYFKNLTQFYSPEFINENHTLLLAQFEILLPELIPSVLPFLQKELDSATKYIYENSLRNQILILSLSENCLNELMWAHYADSHKGFVIVFNARHPFFHQKKTEQDSLRHVRKVTYQDNRPYGNIVELNETEMWLTKSKRWEYESEWRMLMAPNFSHSSYKS